MRELILQSLPLLTVLSAAIVLLLIRSFWKKANAEFLLVLFFIAIAVSIWFAWNNWLGNLKPETFLAFDHLSSIGMILIFLSAGMAAISGYNYISVRNLPWPEFLALILFAAFGGACMVSASSLVTILIGLETLSITAYAMAGYLKDERSIESAIKYFVLGASASAIFIFGLAFFYGATGTLELGTWNLKPETWNLKLFLLGISLITAGFCFKIAAVPFQWWTPDVYQGAPLPVTSFFATAVKAAAFIAFFRIFGSISGAGFSLRPMQLIAVISIATMTFANLAALFQEDIKRMLAYSSIAHAGYILLAFVFIQQDAAGAQASMLYYLLAYIMMTAGAFGILIYWSGSQKFPFEKTTLSDFSGLGRTSPWLAFTFSIFLLSLAGFPPTGGFFAKFYLFKSAVQHGYVTLVVIALLNSLVSVYYYMRPVVSMYFGQSAELTNSRTYELTNFSVIGIILFCLIAVIFLGLFPSTIIQILVHV